MTTMDYKAEAERLIELFLNHVKSERPPKPNGYYHAKACAAICVKEIIDSHVQVGWSVTYKTNAYEYWNKVLEHINSNQ